MATKPITTVLSEDYAALLRAENERLREALERAHNEAYWAHWNLTQCGHDCNDWNRARDKLQRSSEDIDRVLEAAG